MNAGPPTGTAAGAAAFSSCSRSIRSTVAGEGCWPFFSLVKSDQMPGGSVLATPAWALICAHQRYDDVISDFPRLTSTITLVWGW